MNKTASCTLLLRILLVVGCITILAVTGRAQSDSSRLRVSLLTCSPGAELYSTFGHSALRITDSITGTDIVYNYGVFDFYDPDFYIKFVRGKLRYFLDQQAFGDFLYSYSMENRSVSEQVLNLDDTQKRNLQNFLFENLRPENRSYKYDFLFDNCTTRLRDLILRMSGTTLKTDIIRQPGKTFRDHLHHYLDLNRMYWSKLGIDLLLGARLDRPMTNHEAMFLPDFLEIGLDSIRYEKASLVAEKKSLFERSVAAGQQQDWIFHPLIILGLFSVLLFILSRHKAEWSRSLLRVGDFLLFLVSGLIGLLLVFMWFGTDHTVCAQNLNLLWAVPTHAAAAFFIRSKSPWAARYFSFISVLSVIALLIWVFQVQELNTALIPIVLVLGWRSYRLSKKTPIS